MKGNKRKEKKRNAISVVAFFLEFLSVRNEIYFNFSKQNKTKPKLCSNLEEFHFMAKMKGKKNASFAVNPTADCR